MYICRLWLVVDLRRMCVHAATTSELHVYMYMQICIGDVMRLHVNHFVRSEKSKCVSKRQTQVYIVQIYVKQRRDLRTALVYAYMFICMYIACMYARLHASVLYFLHVYYICGGCTVQFLHQLFRACACVQYTWKNVCITLVEKHQKPRTLITKPLSLICTVHT